MKRPLAQTFRSLPGILANTLPMKMHTALTLASLAIIFTAMAHADAVVQSAASGAWSEPKTWAGAKVPAAGSKVQILAGHSVVYDRNSPDAIRAIFIAGALRFATDQADQFQQLCVAVCRMA